MHNPNRSRLAIVACALSIGFGTVSLAQTVKSPEVAKTSPPEDRLGRSTPRGAVFGFLTAARKQDYKTAALYLNTRLRNEAAADLARQLYVVLDRRLPPRLTQLSDRPEGSLSYLSEPNHDLVGAIPTDEGAFDLVLERVEKPTVGPIWLFSSQTLERIPDVYDEVESVAVESLMPAFLTKPRIFGIALAEWLGVFIGLPIVYFVLVLIHRLLSHAAGRLRRRLLRNSHLRDPKLFPSALRLFVVVLIIRWMLAKLSLPLLARQFWSSIGVVILISASVWLATQMIAWAEDHIHRRFIRNNLNAATPLLRFTRRAVNLLIMFVGVVFGLSYFGVNPTAALAGLGVGGIAIALAAQRTLENVIGGLSLIFDRAIAVGDAVKVSGTDGAITEIGLRSTRIRTTDRSIVSVPNGVMANASLENLSARDKFRFQHTIGLCYETTVSQIRSVLEQLESLLAKHAGIDTETIRVRFIRFGASSLDIEIFAYLIARDWGQFLAQQQSLLLQIMDIVERAGVGIAFPSQTLYFGGSTRSERLPANGQGDSRAAANLSPH